MAAQTEEFMGRILHWIMVMLVTLLLGRTPVAAIHEGVLADLKVLKSADQLVVCASLDPPVSMVELRIWSDRNRSISTIREISPHNPDPVLSEKRNHGLDGNIWYPVVDLELERDMEAVARFSLETAGSVGVINGPFFNEATPLEPELQIPACQLHFWENSFFLSSKLDRLADFFLRIRIPTPGGTLKRTFRLLSEDWSGVVALVHSDGDETRVLSEVRIQAEPFRPKPFASGDQLDPGRLRAGLAAAVDFTLRSQIKDPVHPARGGLFLFYDLDARIYRSSHWVWGWGPSVSLLLQAPDFAPGLDRRRLEKASLEIGEAALRFRLHDPGSPVDGVTISRWDRGLEWERGYVGAVTPADALFLAGWAWVPLYERTGDPKFLQAAARQCEATESLLDRWKIVPHSYYFELGRWSDWVIDETGFGVEGYDAMYRVTGDQRFRRGGRTYVNRHLEVFEREDGLWNRQYQFETGEVTPTHHMTRGLGWVLEGLLAANRLLPDEGYLEKAERLAKSVMTYQRPDGAWTWRCDRPVEEVGYSEKGTALWSYLLYRLYSATGRSSYLESARRALIWCQENLYAGPDREAYGSIVGCSPQSGVGYRRWFRVSCTYTSAFFGLACLEELKLAAGKQVGRTQSGAQPNVGH